MVIWCQQLTHWKSPWCWERLRAEESIKGWDGCMASPMQWTWTWANFGRWWGTERPGICSPWGCNEVDTTRVLNNRTKIFQLSFDYSHNVSYNLFLPQCFFFPSIHSFSSNSHHNNLITFSVNTMLKNLCS